MQKHRILLYLTVLSVVSHITVSTVYAYNGSARVYYNSSLSIGLTSSINSRLNSYGYSSLRSGDPSTGVLSTALSSSCNAVFIHTHGNNGLLTCSNGYLYSSSLTYSDIGFAYLSACYSARPASSVNSFRGKMESLGVPLTLGFKNTISASTSSNGIHYYNDQVYYYMTSMNFSLLVSTASAKADMYSAYGAYYGAEYAEFSGMLNGLP